MARNAHGEQLGSIGRVKADDVCATKLKGKHFLSIHISHSLSEEVWWYDQKRIKLLMGSVLGLDARL